MLKTKHIRISFLLLVTTAVAAGFIFSLEPIPQDRAYHNFSDTLNLFGIPNFWNVVSNLLFLFVGLIGLYKLYVAKSLNIDASFTVAYLLLFAGVVLVSFGSIYYHLSPTNETLFWDRLAMSICFMALFSIIVGEYISIKLGKLLLVPLVIIGVLSVFYWRHTELNQAGDLRLYILIQYLPIVLIPLILLTSDSIYNDGKTYWLLLICYMVAKIFEHYDRDIYGVLDRIGGHPFKHIAAAIGLYVVIFNYEKRKSIK